VHLGDAISHHANMYVCIRRSHHARERDSASGLEKKTGGDRERQTEHGRQRRDAIYADIHTCLYVDVYIYVCVRVCRLKDLFDLHACIPLKDSI